jgi:hypothetical protein
MTGSGRGRAGSSGVASPSEEAGVQAGVEGTGGGDVAMGRPGEPAHAHAADAATKTATAAVDRLNIPSC